MSAVQTAAPVKVSQDTLALVTAELMTRLDYPWSTEQMNDCMNTAWAICSQAAAWSTSGPPTT